MESFVEKNPVANPSSYGLKLVKRSAKKDADKNEKDNKSKKKKEEEQATWLSGAATLVAAGVQHMDTLLFQQRESGGTRNRTNTALRKLQCFGVDPSQCLSAEDAGIYTRYRYQYNNIYSIYLILILLIVCFFSLSTPFRKYIGFTVPRVLVLIKQSLIKHNGLKEEGIFRLAGSESKMKDIKLQVIRIRFLLSYLLSFGIDSMLSSFFLLIKIYSL